MISKIINYKAIKKENRKHDWLVDLFHFAVLLNILVLAYGFIIGF